LLLGFGADAEALDRLARRVKRSEQVVGAPEQRVRCCRCEQGSLRATNHVGQRTTGVRCRFGAGGIIPVCTHGKC
jgi:hypothetical protein